MLGDGGAKQREKATVVVLLLAMINMIKCQVRETVVMERVTKELILSWIKTI